MYCAVIIKRNNTARKYKQHYKGKNSVIRMVHSMPLKNVSGQSYKVKIRTFGSSLVTTVILNFKETL